MEEGHSTSTEDCCGASNDSLSLEDGVTEVDQNNNNDKDLLPLTLQGLQKTGDSFSSYRTFQRTHWPRKTHVALMIWVSGTPAPPKPLKVSRITADRSNTSNTAGSTNTQDFHSMAVLEHNGPGIPSSCRGHSFTRAACLCPPVILGTWTQKEKWMFPRGRGPVTGHEVSPTGEGVGHHGDSRGRG